MTKRPWWVHIALWGVGTRRLATFFVWFSLAIAAGAGIYGLVNPFGFLGLGLLVSALWYWRAVVWVDANDRWG